MHFKSILYMNEYLFVPSIIKLNSCHYLPHYLTSLCRSKERFPIFDYKTGMKQPKAFRKLNIEWHGQTYRNIQCNYHSCFCLEKEAMKKDGSFGIRL